MSGSCRTSRSSVTISREGDQPRAIAELTEGVLRGDQYQTLLGVTGSGKTFTMANVIANVKRPTLLIAHNKTLAAQLYGEFKELFPNNAVEYFVSYYDYYQPEAYVPSSDTYIEKDSSINDEIERMRHSATHSLAHPRRRDHRGQRVLHLRPGHRALLRGHGHHREPGRGAGPRHAHAPPGGGPVRAQRLRLPPRHLPRSRRHRGDLPRLRGGARRPRQLLRRRGGEDHRVRSAARPHPGRAGEDRHLPRQPLRDGGGHPQARAPDHPRRAGRAAPGASRARASCWRPSGWSSARCSIWR